MIKRRLATLMLSFILLVLLLPVVPVAAAAVLRDVMPDENLRQAVRDKLSIKYVIIVGMLLESVFFAGLYHFTDFWLIIPFFIAGGLGGNMIDTSIRSLTFKALGPGGRGRKLGIYQLASTGGFGIGIVLGGFMLAMLAGKVKDATGVFTYSFYASASLLVVAAIVTLFVRAPHHHEVEAQ